MKGFDDCGAQTGDAHVMRNGEASESLGYVISS